MSESDDFQIRVMRREEVALAIDLAAAEGWNPGINDAACFFTADANGFLIGELAGNMVGCISAVSYAGRFGFVGLYIVRPEFRGRGFGIQLWQAAMARLQGHNIGLDGVLGCTMRLRRTLPLATRFSWMCRRIILPLSR